MNRKTRKDLERRVQEYVKSLPPASLSDEEQQRMVSELLRADRGTVQPHDGSQRPVNPDTEPFPPQRRNTPAWVYAAAAVVILAAAATMYQRWSAPDAGGLAQQAQRADSVHDNTPARTDAGEGSVSAGSEAGAPGSPRRALAFAPVQAVFTFRNTEAAPASDSAQFNTAISRVEAELRREGIRYTRDSYALNTVVEVADVTGAGSADTRLRFTANFSTGTIEIHPARFTLRSAKPGEERLRLFIERLRAEVYNAARGG